MKVVLRGRKNMKEAKQPPSLKYNYKVVCLLCLYTVAEVNNSSSQDNPNRLS